MQPWFEFFAEEVIGEGGVGDGVDEESTVVFFEIQGVGMVGGEVVVEAIFDGVMSFVFFIYPDFMLGNHGFHEIGVFLGIRPPTDFFRFDELLSRGPRVEIAGKISIAKQAVVVESVKVFDDVADG